MPVLSVLTVHDAPSLAPGLVGVLTRLRGSRHVLVGNELAEPVGRREF